MATFNNSVLNNLLMNLVFAKIELNTSLGNVLIKGATRRG